MMATRHNSADPPEHYRAVGRRHLGIGVVRFLLTAVSLLLLVPLAYLMRMRAWFDRTLRRRHNSQLYRLSSSWRQ